MGRRTQNGNEDDALWEMVVRSVKPLHRKKPARPEALAPKPTPVKIERGATLPRASSRKPQPAQPPAKGFDRATETKLKKGKLPLEGRLDLHGMTQEQAYGALHRFIRMAYGNGARTVLVITGKGRVGGGGVLRRMVPLWLEDGELRGIVLAATPAHAKDGGEGALYVRLRNPERK